MDRSSLPKSRYTFNPNSMAMESDLLDSNIMNEKASGKFKKRQGPNNDKMTGLIEVKPKQLHQIAQINQNMSYVIQAQKTA